jgi:translation initiation factor IF-2
MNDTSKPKNDKADGKTLTLSAKPASTLSLKRPEAAAGAAPAGGGSGSRVKQSFSGGVTKSVAVEVKRRRVTKPGETTAPVAPAVTSNTATPAPASSSTASNVDSRRLEALKNINNEPPKSRFAFTVAETEAQRQAEREAENKEAEKTAAEVRRPLTPEELRQRELAEMQEIETDEKNRRDAENKRLDSARPATTSTTATTNASPAAAAALSRVLPGRREEEDDRNANRNNKASRGRGDDRRRDGRITLTQALSGEPEIERGRSVASFKRAREKEKRNMMQEQREKISREVVLPEFITVGDLANRMAERAGDVIKALMKMGMMVTVTQSIDADTAELIANELGHTVKRVSESSVEEGLQGSEDETSSLIARPPVVTIMGHVDHGKTSLLDAFRRTDVVAGEAGGITQHIGAYQITSASGQKITFIDTPGHAAFSEMRARGANTTDIVILVVAANDGIMPQTVEALSHAKAAGVPIIVAINKIDLPDANPQRVKEMLLSHEIVVEEMGGDVMAIEVSAKKKLNLDKLEEAILLQSEVMELKSNPNRDAIGVVLEAKMEQGRGSVATILVQKGTLKVGDIFVTGTEVGRVRALVSDHGKRIKEATPGMPVEVLGLNGTPNAGDDFVVVGDEAKARDVAEYRARKKRDAAAARANKSSIEDMLSQIQAGDKRELAVIIKGDVHGSVEAINAALHKLVEENTEVGLRTLHIGVGAINESDISLAKATNALIIGFNVRANPQARDLARRDSIDLRYYSVIYNAIDDVKALLTGLLSPLQKEAISGYAEIRQVFDLTKAGKIAGCMVTEGKIKRGSKVRLLRDSVVIHEGTLKSLKRGKDDAREVQSGFECGVAFDNYDDMRAGDMIEAFDIEETAAVL